MARAPHNPADARWGTQSERRSRWQLSVRELHSLRAQLGLLTPARLYVIGSPVQRSMSPLMHNLGPATARLPARLR